MSVVLLLLFCRILYDVHAQGTAKATSYPIGLTLPNVPHEYAVLNKSPRTISVSGAITALTKVPRVVKLENGNQVLASFIAKNSRAAKGVPIELGVIETNKDEESGSASGDDHQKFYSVDGIKKPCVKECASTEQDEGEDDEVPEPEDGPEPDIPVELGSAITEKDENTDETNTVTYLPIRTPEQFIMVESISDEDKKVLDESGNGSGDSLTEEQSGNDRNERSINDNLDNSQQMNTTSIAANTDGNFDGELLQSYHKETGVEQTTDSILNTHPRERRSLKTHYKRKQIRKQGKHLKQTNTKSLKTKRKHKKGTKASSNRERKLGKKVTGHHTKRSDIEADKELLKTIENFNSIAASKRNVPEKKPMKRYMKNLAHDVRSVLYQARSALRETGRVIHGLRRVISGADALTSFSNNAVKFAKYYSLEPNNATVDYLEEKAIVSVLEAQRAASEAKEAAKLAKRALSRTQAVEKKMEVAAHHHKKLKGASRYVKIAVKQASRASKAADLALRFKEQTEKDVVMMDQELRKMGAQLAAQNRGDAKHNNITTSVSIGDQVKNIRNQSQAKSAPIISLADSSLSDEQAPDVQLLLPKIYKDKERKISIEKIPEKTTSPLENIKESSLKSESEPSSYENYFQMKQKQLEKQLLNKTVPAVAREKETNPLQHHSRKYALHGVKHVVHGANGHPVKVIDMIPPSQPEEVKPAEDGIELEYIASLNKKIAQIKKEEEEATQRLKAVELARTFAAVKEKKGDDELTPLKNAEDNEPHLTAEFSTLKEPSILKTNVPVATDQDVSLRHRIALTHENVSPKYIVNFAKKQTIHHRSFQKPVHIFPGEYTGFKKQEIPIRRTNSGINPKSKIALTAIDNEIENAFSNDENDVIANDFDPKRKRENFKSEKKLFKTINEENIEGDISGSGDSESSNVNNPDVSFTGSRASVAVKVHNNKETKRSTTQNKVEDLIDPFGFNRVSNTNEGGIIDRTVIPKPEYLVPNFKRSQIPLPPQIYLKLTRDDVVNDGKK